MRVNIENKRNSTSRSDKLVSNLKMCRHELLKNKNKNLGENKKYIV